MSSVCCCTKTGTESEHWFASNILARAQSAVRHMARYMRQTLIERASQGMVNRVNRFINVNESTSPDGKIFYFYFYLF